MALTVSSRHSQRLKLWPKAADAFCYGAVYFMSRLVFDSFLIVHHLHPPKPGMTCRQSFKIQISDRAFIRFVVLQIIFMSSPFLPVTSLPAGLPAIFVIHATKFIERRKLIEKQMSSLGVIFEFVLDFDISDISPEIHQQFFQNSELLPSQQSCALKHWQAMTLIVKRQLSRALVLEDDVILASNFLEVLNRMMREELSIITPHVTFLGCGGHYYIPHEEIVADRLLYPRNQGKFADSYIVSLDAAKRRIDWIAEHGITRPIDHLFEQIDREQHNAMFWLEPPIVEQGSHNGTFGSTLEKSYPLWFQSLQFRWKKFWRRRHHH